LNQVRHHAVLGHGMAVQAIRAHAQAGTKVGFAENITSAVPAIDTPENVQAADTATRELNAQYLTVMLEGRYTDGYLANAGADAPKFTDEELKTIASPLDFVGINVYRPSVYVVASEDPAGYREIPINASHPKMASSWHLFDPEVAYWAPRQVRSLWNVDSIFITENGCAASDVVADDGLVYDSDRVMFLRACLGQLQRATSEGVPVNGYFLWSAQDNFEWTAGYGNRFGIIYVDVDTLPRIPKLSADWFREAARRNAVVCATSSNRKISVRPLASPQARPESPRGAEQPSVSPRPGSPRRFAPANRWQRPTSSPVAETVPPRSWD